MKLLSMGRGSLDFAKQLVADKLPEEPTPPTDLPCVAGAGFVYRWKQSKKMSVARSASTSLLIEPLTTFVWTETFLKCA